MEKVASKEEAEGCVSKGDVLQTSEQNANLEESIGKRIVLRPFLRLWFMAFWGSWQMRERTPSNMKSHQSLVTQNGVERLFISQDSCKLNL